MIWEVHPPYGPEGEVAIVEADTAEAAIELASEEFAMEYAMADGLIYQPLRRDAAWSAEPLERARIYTQI